MSAQGTGFRPTDAEWVVLLFFAKHCEEAAEQEHPFAAAYWSKRAFALSREVAARGVRS